MRPLGRLSPRLGGVGRGCLRALLVLLHEVQEFLYRLFAEFGSWRVTDQRGKTGSAQRHSHDDAVITAEKHMRDFLRSGCHSLNWKSFSEQWLGRIGHLGPLDASIIRVVEVGIKKWCRSTESNMTS